MSAPISRAGELYISAGRKLERAAELGLKAMGREGEAATFRILKGDEFAELAAAGAERLRAQQKNAQTEAVEDIERAIKAENEAKET